MGEVKVRTETDVRRLVEGDGFESIMVTVNNGKAWLSQDAVISAPLAAVRVIIEALQAAAKEAGDE